MSRRKVSPVSLSFLDIMFCGFGAVVLLVLVLNHDTVKSRKEVFTDLRAEAVRLEKEVLIGEEDLLLRNDSGRRFINVSHELGPDFQEKFVSRGSAAGDYDNDGDMDLLVLNLDARARLLRNDGGNSRNWVMIHLIGTTSNRDGIGARARVTSGGKTQTRMRVSSAGYLSQGDHRLQFGLGDEGQIERIEIRWPSGKVQTLENVSANRLITVTEPSS